MIVTQRKSKHKIKVTLERKGSPELYEWCAERFGPGGRNKHLRWRYGWLQDKETFYFKHQKDASMFVMKWGL